MSAEDAVNVFKAQLAVPNNEPVIPFVIESEPVISCWLLALINNLLFSIGLVPPTNIFTWLLPDVLPIIIPGASENKYECPPIHPG